MVLALYGIEFERTKCQLISFLNFEFLDTMLADGAFCCFGQMVNVVASSLHLPNMRNARVIPTLFTDCIFRIFMEFSQSPLTVGFNPTHRRDIMDL